MVEFHFAKSLPTGEVQARIHRDPTISEPVRQLALTLAEQYGRYLLVYEAAAVSLTDSSPSRCFGGKSWKLYAPIPP